MNVQATVAGAIPGTPRQLRTTGSSAVPSIIRHESRANWFFTTVTWKSGFRVCEGIVEMSMPAVMMRSVTANTFAMTAM